MKLGIIGTGMIVKQFLPVLSEMDELEIVGIQSTERSIGTARELCEIYRVPCAATRMRDLCKAGADTVYVAVPNHLHYACCKEALQRGMHVIVEKPLASNAKEAEELAEIAERKGLFLFEAISSQHLASYEKIRQWLPRIGDVKMVQAHFSQYSSRYDAFLRGEIQPAFDREKSGGALMDLNVYNMHFVMGLFGMPERAEYFANVDQGIDTSGALILKYPGFSAVCAAAKDCSGLRMGVIQGTKGSIYTEEALSIIGKVRLELRDGTAESFQDGFSTKEAYFIPEFRDFARAVEERDEKYCRDLLNRSLAVSRVQTEVRKKAGIVFPCD